MHAQDALNSSQVLPSPVFSAAAAAAAGHLFDSAQQAPGASAGFPTSQAQQLLGRQQQVWTRGLRLRSAHGSGAQGFV